MVPNLVAGHHLHHAQIRRQFPTDSLRRDLGFRMVDWCASDRLDLDVDLGQVNAVPSNVNPPRPARPAIALTSGFIHEGIVEFHKPEGARLSSAVGIEAESSASAAPDVNGH